MQAQPLPAKTGVILVDHGSKHAAANDMLVHVAQAYREATGAAIVEPAHMELAEPTIEQAFARCVEQGARLVIVHPYFLSPGRHSTTDIPRLAAQAAANHPGVAYRVTEPLGLDPRLTDVIQRRVEETLDTLDA
ncbi:MAG: CbiX/SirB N-terminal domain-containing protein [Candidatus Hydrogenedentota bacterium]